MFLRYPIRQCQDRHDPIDCAPHRARQPRGSPPRKQLHRKGLTSAFCLRRDHADYRGGIALPGIAAAVGLVLMIVR
jgi:hypothetical protein